MVRPVAPQKSILVDIILNRKSILVKRNAHWQEGGNAYLRIGGSVYLRDKKITKKGNNHWTPSENNDQHLKKMFRQVLMRTRLNPIYSHP
jgi:hypothetical protein